MESSQSTPDIPLGHTFPVESKHLVNTNDPVKEDEEDEPTDLELAEAYCEVTKAEWAGKETKARLLHLALEIPQPYEGENINTMHPFWTEGEYKKIKTHYLDFLLSL